jgi:hypothetical protein
MIEVLKQIIKAHDDLHIARVDYGLSTYPAISANHERLKLRLEEARHNNEIAIQAGKQAIAEFESQEPVAWIWKDIYGQEIVSLFEPRFNSAPLYTAPPQRTEPICPECKAEVLYECVACSSNNYPPAQPAQRKPLTDQQYFEIGQRHWVSSYKVAQIHKEIDEAAHGIKENT